MRERESFNLYFNSPCLHNQTVTIFEKQQIQNHWNINVDCFTHCILTHFFNSNKFSYGCLKVKKSHFPVAPDNITA